MIAYVSIPALVALTFKLALIGYSLRYPAQNPVARLFLALLLILALQNVIEFWLLNYYTHYGLTPLLRIGGFAYVALLLLVGTIILHLSIALSFDESSQPSQRHIWILYLPAVALDCLLLSTDRLIIGFKPFLSYSIVRDPGPWYFLIEGYGLLYLTATLAILIYGARSSRPALLRIRNRLWLLGLAPMVLFLLHVVIADYVGGFRLSTPVHLPIAITFFLVVTTYAIFQHPRRGSFYRFLYCLFDIEAYLPWSQAHQNKSAFYDRVRTMTANIGTRGSVSEIVQQLAEVLRCPVLLADKRSPVAALAGQASDMITFPRNALMDIDTTILAHEISRTIPGTHALMAKHKVAAIVPFHSYSRAASWLLLGESFSEQVYTPADFDIVKKLFDRLAGHLLDEQMRMRSKIEAAQQQSDTLLGQIHETSRQLKVMERELRAVEAENRGLAFRNRGSPPGDVVRVTDGPEGGEQTASGGKTLDDYVRELEQRMIVQALERSGGNQAKAAELLGLRPNTLHYKIQRYNLTDRKR